MTIDEFAKKYNACLDGVKWAKKYCKTGLMSEAYEKLKKGKSKAVKEFFEWVFYRAHPENIVRKVSCRFVRETPLADGRKVWDLLTDERSRRAVEVAELFADGLATKEELATAAAAAYSAAKAVATASAAANDAANDATAAAAYSAAKAAAKEAQIKIMMEYGNPFLKGGDDE